MSILLEAEVNSNLFLGGGKEKKRKEKEKRRKTRKAYVFKQDGTFITSPITMTDRRYQSPRIHF
jgi:hypothetical protein